LEKLFLAAISRSQRHGHSLAVPEVSSLDFFYRHFGAAVLASQLVSSDCLANVLGLGFNDFQK
jgi:hypothetical protein